MNTLLLFVCHTSIFYHIHHISLLLCPTALPTTFTHTHTWGSCSRQNTPPQHRTPASRARRPRCGRRCSQRSTAHRRKNPGKCQKKTIFRPLGEKVVASSLFLGGGNLGGRRQCAPDISTSTMPKQTKPYSTRSPTRLAARRLTSVAIVAYVGVM